MSNGPTHHSGPGRDGPERWHRHPAIVQAVPAVITGVVTLGVTLLAILTASRGGHLPDAVSPPASVVTVTATATVQPTVTVTQAPGDPTGSTTPVTGRVTWKKRIHIPRGYALDIDEAAPKVLSDPQDAGADFTVYNTAGDRAAIGTSSRSGKARVVAPSLTDCQEALEVNVQGPSYPIDVGTTVCVLSGRETNPHLASVHLVKFDKSDFSSDFDVTVWQLGG